MKRAAELTQLRQLCKLGLHSEAIMPAFLRSLRALVPAGLGAFFWIDRDGDMTNMYSEKMLAADVTTRYFSQHYESAVHSFRAQVLAQVRDGKLVRESVVDSAMLESDYYREILAPLGAFRMLYGVLHHRGTPLGQLSLYRPREAPAFGSEERAVFEVACRYLQQTLHDRTAPAAAPAEQFRESGQAALLVCSPDGRVQQASGRGHALLAQASGCRINRFTMVGELEQAGLDLLRRLLAGALAQTASQDVPAYSLHVANEWGAFRLRAYPISEGFGVLIERYEHFLVRLVDAMRGLRLSAQQREVALLLARGFTNVQVAREMGVSLNTASYHVKQLFAKLDAHDRDEVIARILEGHTVRH
jgi:DNA-binding CsgD family transcriptional regulator